MSNPIWSEEQERINTLETLEYLITFFEEKDDWQNLHSYKILEYFPKENQDPFSYTPNVYELFNIKMEIEDGCVIFNDIEGILEENMYKNTPLPLHHFLVDNIIFMGMQSEPDPHITISFGDGYIQIYY